MKTRTHFTFRVDTWTADGARPPDGVRSHSLPRLHTRRKNSVRLRRPGRPHQAPFRRRSARTFAAFAARSLRQAVNFFPMTITDRSPAARCRARIRKNFGHARTDCAVLAVAFLQQETGAMPAVGPRR